MFKKDVNFNYHFYNNTNSFPQNFSNPNTHRSLKNSKNKYVYSNENK